ncbi:hypothetical protein EON65_00905, partial [archaeon]
MKGRIFGTDEIISLTMMEYHMRYNTDGGENPYDMRAEMDKTAPPDPAKLLKEQEKERQYRMQMKAMEIKRNLLLNQIVSSTDVLSILTYLHASELHLSLLISLNTWKQLYYYQSGGVFRDILTVHIQVLKLCLQKCGGMPGVYKSLLQLSPTTDVSAYPPAIRIKALEIFRQELAKEMDGKKKLSTQLMKVLQQHNVGNVLERLQAMPFSTMGAPTIGSTGDAQGNVGTVKHDPLQEMRERDKMLRDAGQIMKTVALEAMAASNAATAAAGGTAPPDSTRSAASSASLQMPMMRAPMPGGLPPGYAPPGFMPQGFVPQGFAAPQGFGVPQGIAAPQNLGAPEGSAPPGFTPLPDGSNSYMSYYPASPGYYPPILPGQNMPSGQSSGLQDDSHASGGFGGGSSALVPSSAPGYHMMSPGSVSSYPVMSYMPQGINNPVPMFPGYYQTPTLVDPYTGIPYKSNNSSSGQPIQPGQPFPMYGTPGSTMGLSQFHMNYAMPPQGFVFPFQTGLIQYQPQPKNKTATTNNAGVVTEGDSGGAKESQGGDTSSTAAGGSSESFCRPASSTASLAEMFVKSNKARQATREGGKSDDGSKEKFSNPLFKSPATGFDRQHRRPSKVKAIGIGKKFDAQKKSNNADILKAIADASPEYEDANNEEGTGSDAVSTVTASTSSSLSDHPLYQLHVIVDSIIADALSGQVTALAYLSSIGESYSYWEKGQSGVAVSQFNFLFTTYPAYFPRAHAVLAHYASLPDSSPPPQELQDIFKKIRGVLEYIYRSRVGGGHIGGDGEESLRNEPRGKLMHSPSWRGNKEDKGGNTPSPLRKELKKSSSIKKVERAESDKLIADGSTSPSKLDLAVGAEDSEDDEERLRVYKPMVETAECGVQTLYDPYFYNKNDKTDTLASPSTSIITAPKIALPPPPA